MKGLSEQSDNITSGQIDDENEIGNRLFGRSRTILFFILIFLLLVSASLSTFGQEEKSLREALSGVPFPLQMTLKELDNTWRCVTIRASGTVSGNTSVNVTGNSPGSGSSPVSQNNIVGAVGSNRTYVTHGQSVMLAGRSYLVAYHLPNALDLGSLLQMVAMKSAPSIPTLTPESTLPLSLLDLQSVGSLEDIRAFDLQSELKESETAAKKLGDLLKSQGGSAQSNTNSKESKAKTSKPPPQQP